MNFEYNDLFGKKVAEYLKKLNEGITKSKRYKKEDLANASCINPSTLSHYLSGARRPSAEAILRILAALCVSYDDSIEIFRIAGFDITYDCYPDIHIYREILLSPQMEAEEINRLLCLLHVEKKKDFTLEKKEKLSATIDEESAKQYFAYRLK